MSNYIYNPLIRLGLDRVNGSGSTPLIPSTQVVADYSVLPDPVVNDGLYYHVQNTIKTGVWPLRVTRSSGIYRATGGAWNYEGADVDSYLSDDKLLFKDDGTGNGLGYELANLTTDRRATWQDKDGTVAFLGDITNIYNADDALTGNRQVNGAGFSLDFGYTSNL